MQHWLRPLLLIVLLTVPDWTAAVPFSDPVPPGGRTNPFGLTPSEWLDSRRRGLIHALNWPDVDHGLMLPYPMMQRAVRLMNGVPGARLFLRSIGFTKFGTTWEELYNGLGLSPYPTEEGTGAFFVPFKDGVRPDLPLGASLQINARGVQIWTLACAACHARNLFGRHIIGLPTLTAEATTLLHFGVRAKNIPRSVVWAMAGGDRRSYETFRTTQHNLRFTAHVEPASLVTDTAVSAMALSLSRREADPHATRTWRSRRRPRPNDLWQLPHDAKPGTWWVVKYKNRFRLDGSIQGNPIVSNFVAADLAHGVDLYGLETWMASNPAVLRDLTTAVFAAQAPRWTDYFPAASIDLARAQRGQQHFNQTCAACHGIYRKGWNEADAEERTSEDLLATTEVTYHPETPVVDVGTDPGFHLATAVAAADFNRLKVFRDRNITMTATGGYVPPPLVGIWARYPYFHNGAAPTLCAVLTRSDSRPSTYVVQDSLDKDRDYDQSCVGFPQGADIDSRWRGNARRIHDTSKPGLSRRGHDEGIFLTDGEELLTPAQKLEIIEFLKTL